MENTRDNAVQFKAGSTRGQRFVKSTCRLRDGALVLALAIAGLPWLAPAAPDTYFGWDTNTLPPAGPGSDNPGRLLSHPNADQAAARFLSRLVGVATETFEGLADRSTPTSLAFGQDTATLAGSPVIYNVPENTYAGTFPISGNQFLLLLANSASFFQIDFDTPQAAFGFYATDIELARLNVTLVTAGGQQTSLAVPTPVGEQPTGSVFFFGAIHTDFPFKSVKFAREGTAQDGFGFDNLTIGRLEQVHPEPASLAVSLASGVTPRIELTGTPGATYRIDYAVSLSTANWTPLTTNLLSASPFVFVDTEPVTTQSRRFYRAVAVE